MSDVETRFHETWLGMVQPVDGLVVSIPALVEAQCMERHPPELQQRLHALAPLLTPGDDDDGQRRIADLDAFLSDLLGLTPDLFDRGDALPADLSLWVPEGQQLLRPTLGLRRLDAGDDGEAAAATETDAAAGVADDTTPAGCAGARYVALVWDVPAGLPLDKPETATGDWSYPAAAKFDRLLRVCRVPIGLLTNREVVRLVYAPHGESSGSITFRIDDMATVGGRPILDAFVALLSAQRFFGVAPEHQLPQILRASRARQANVTNELAAQVFQALEILLAGFEQAEERDGRRLFREAVRGEDDEAYGGLLTVLLRLVFLLYAEDHGVMPVEDEVYANHLSLLGLFHQLQRDHGEHPDSMSRRFGAWPRLLALFRAVYLGARHESAAGTFVLPARRGRLFNPETYPFLEGWERVGGAPLAVAEERAATRTPALDDETVFRVLEKLLIVEGQRLSYRALDVEQIGSVYERLMGYHVVELPHAAVCLRPQRVWVTAEEVQAVAPAQRAKWLQETTNLAKAQAEALAAELRSAVDTEAVLRALETQRAPGSERAPAGRLVLQPGSERRRTSSHYTPRSLSQPIVEKTLQPLLRAMGETPGSAQLLQLKVCDPAMGSGAFLVESCRFLADQLVAAWTREGVATTVAPAGQDLVLHARRLVAQRCLYGVDKNRLAVELAKLSLWLVTLAKDLPFTFVDHALRWGDSLVGLDAKQLRGFHWAATGQIDWLRAELDAALDDALERRQRILELASATDEAATREKEWLLENADDALERIRLIGDLVVGAFFGAGKKKAREEERKRRLVLVQDWLTAGGNAPAELTALRDQVRQEVPVFHWPLEYPEIFFDARPDPLDADRTSGAAMMDAFVGNPPFAGKNAMSAALGMKYIEWLQDLHAGSHGNADLCSHFFRRADMWLGSHGTIGLIATNTIAQGDTRSSGLQAMLRDGLIVYDATTDMKWPGEAAVVVSVVHLAKGQATRGTPRPFRLNSDRVSTINSRLLPMKERKDPVCLISNQARCYQGSIVLGMGFTLTPEERNKLIMEDPTNGERIFPYIGGREVNANWDQSFERFAIDFGDASLEEAENWGALLERIRSLVKPERDRQNRKVYRDRWWQYAERRPALYAALRGRERCLVTLFTAKHLVFSFQPAGRVFANTLWVIPRGEDAEFSVLQSRVHSCWAWFLSSSMKTDLRYSASDCFETFPFPLSRTEQAIATLASAGTTVYDARTRYMRGIQQGLTETYNRLKEPACDDPPIVELRRLHEAMDRAVLDAYGWADLAVPPYAPATAEEQAAVQAFEDEVIDRLFLLNAERAKEEVLLGTKRTGKGAPKGARKSPPGQMTLGLGSNEDASDGDQE